MKSTRTYTMDTRARAVEETRERIVGALFALGSERLFTDISLSDVAAAAGTSVQTILRHFGSRDGLVDATIQHALSTIKDEREAPVGQVDAIIRVLLDHYEQRGRLTVQMLAQEQSHPDLAKVTAFGRELHRTWVERVFAPYVSDDPELATLLVAATDVYVWKLLRLDQQLSRPDAEHHLTRLVRSLVPGAD